VTQVALSTPRLLLRVPEAGDFEAWARFCADGETMRYLGGAQDRSTAGRTMCAMTGAWTIRGFSMFSVIERASGRWIGRVGPWQPEGWPGTEVGWGILPEFAGRGLAREAAVATIDYAVDGLGWSDVIHTIHPDNVASIALAKRLGATARGPTQLPGPLSAMRVDAWGQTADAWRAARPYRRTIPSDRNRRHPGSRPG
jgi:RimJ/RimL family protein N-acetyltransferase